MFSKYGDNLFKIMKKVIALSRLNRMKEAHECLKQILNQKSISLNYGFNRKVFQLTVS